MASILDIGDDVMAVIMSYIDSPEAYLASRLVCRWFYELSERIDGIVLTKFDRERDISTDDIDAYVWYTNYIDTYTAEEVKAREIGLLWGNRLKHGLVDVHCAIEADHVACKYIIREKYIMGYLMSSYLIADGMTRLLFKRLKTKSEIKQYPYSHASSGAVFLVKNNCPLSNIKYYLYDYCAKVHIEKGTLKSGECLIKMTRDDKKELYYADRYEVITYHKNGNKAYYSTGGYGCKRCMTMRWHEDGSIALKHKLIMTKHRDTIESWTYSPTGTLTSYEYYLNSETIISSGFL
jgi:hypothetical protein